MLESDGKANLDWEELRSRLARATHALDEMLVPSREQIRDRLEERARQVIAPMVEARGEKDLVEAIVFSSAGERYAIEARFVHSVAPLGPTTMIPGASRVFSGLANLRGEIIPMIRLSELLGSSGTPVAAAVPWMLVLGDGQPDIGVAIGQEVETRLLGADEIIASETEFEVTPLRKGVTKDAITILDGAALLADGRLLLGPMLERTDIE